MQTDPRTIYRHLLIAAVIGLLAGIPLVILLPPTDLDAAHAAAATPFARAVTSHAVDVASALITCVMISCMAATVLFAIRWRGPREGLLPTLTPVMSICFLIMIGSRAIDDLPKLASGGVLRWMAFAFSAAAGLAGIGLFLFHLLNAHKAQAPTKA